MLRVSALSASAQQPPPVSGLTLVGKFGGTEKLKIIVDPVKGANGDSIATIISRDLDYSDRFLVLSTSNAPASNGPLNYALFTQLGVQGVIEASVMPSGWLRVELHDVNNKMLLQKGDFPLPGSALGKDWRMALHGVSDSIEEWLIGQRGIAQTRIAYVRDGRVWVVDSDGANPTAVTPRGISPNWTPNGRALVYNIVDADVSPIMLTDLATGAQRALTNMRSSVGQDYGAVVTPDGRSVVFTRSAPQGAELYSMPLTGGAAQRLTSSRGKDSGQPAVSPDGRRMAFGSTRAGNNDIYVADIDGANVELLTPGGAGEKTHNTPDWSPDGKFVAYTSGIGGTQQIMLVSVRDQTTRQITDQSRNDDPSWAPDSRHIVLTSLRTGTSQIWVVDTQSGKARQLTRGSAARLSAWSPRLSGTP
ncbi:MAG: PD40 domain-containing protein [Phycisphaerae bacterium]|nr:PD40 domain-containing protein [Gemmatimonadaceae bacterium]